jgi:hypothetical protein
MIKLIKMSKVERAVKREEALKLKMSKFKKTEVKKIESLRRKEIMDRIRIEKREAKAEKKVLKELAAAKKRFMDSISRRHLRDKQDAKAEKQAAKAMQRVRKAKNQTGSGIKVTLPTQDTRPKGFLKRAALSRIKKRNEKIETEDVTLSTQDTRPKGFLKRAALSGMKRRSEKIETKDVKLVGALPELPYCPRQASAIGLSGTIWATPLYCDDTHVMELAQNYAGRDGTIQVNNRNIVSLCHTLYEYIRNLATVENWSEEEKDRITLKF